MVNEFGGFEYGESMKSRDVNLTQLLSLATTKYGVNPFFDIIVDAFGRIGVSNYTFLNTNVYLNF